MPELDPGNLEEAAGITVAEAYVEKIENLVTNVNTDEELEIIHEHLDELKTVAEQPSTTYIEQELDRDEIIEQHNSAIEW